ncbi:MAG: fumarylacetoacetate hydrolase family protein [Halomonadaceae bacterium]|nr:MAG: fumarylacetoacetate hydrolase family protein [Halomonadaceae bacterium]
MFHARFTNATAFSHPVSKVVCVGRNYAAHARELNNPVPDQPLLFIKPASAVCELTQPLCLPNDRGPVHFETELTLLIGDTVSKADAGSALEAVVGVGLALDLTLRDLQQQLKDKGHPWELAKGFDGACPLSSFVPVRGLAADSRFQFTATIDGELRQQGDTADLLQAIPGLLSYMSQHFTLCPGDVVLTGTPAGVGPLYQGQQIVLSLADHLLESTHVAQGPAPDNHAGRV